MRNWIRKAYIRALIIYNRFQMFILTIFVLGFLEILIYSDVVFFLFLMPEVTWPVFLLLVVVGVYKFIKNRNAEKKKSGVN